MLSHTPLPRWAFGADWMWTVGVVGTLYLLAVRRARRAGAHVSRTHVAMFLAGLGALLASFLTPIDTYDNVSFVDHVGQHLILVFVVAPLLALGAPVSVAVAGSPRWIRRRVVEPIVRSMFVAALSGPVIAGTLFVVVQLGVFFPPLFNGALNTGVPHLVQHGLLVVTAFLFWRSVAAIDPPVRRVGSRTRAGLATLVVAIMAALGLVFLASKTPLYSHYAAAPAPWGGGEALESQRQAGWLQLAAGGALTVGVFAALDRARRKLRAAR